MSNHIEKAVALRDETPRPNCAQTVMLAFADELRISPEQLRLIGTHFGHGMKTGRVCGAVTGALMTLGLLLPDDKTAAADLMAYFVERHGNTVDCAPLLASCDEKGGARKPFCDDLIFDAIRFIENRVKKPS